MFDIRHHRGLRNIQPERFNVPGPYKTPIKRLKNFHEKLILVLDSKLVDISKCKAYVTAELYADLTRDGYTCKVAA